MIALVTFGIVGAKVRSNACGVGEEQTGIIDTAPVITQTPTQTPEQVATKTPEQVATQTPVQVATQTPTYGENEQEQVEVTTELEPTCAVE